MADNPPALSDSITQTIRIDAEPGVVFEALTTADLLARWLCHEAEVEARVGGRYRLDWQATDAGTDVRDRGHGEITTIEPGARLEVRLDPSDVPGSTGAIAFELSAESGATSVRLVQSGLDKETAPPFERAWRASLAALRSLLEDDPKDRLRNASMLREVTPPGDDPCGLDCAGGDLWLSDAGTGRIYRLDARSGAVRQEIPFDGETAGLIHDGEALWQAECEQSVLVKLDPTTGEILKRMKIDQAEGELTGLAWDGHNLWLGDSTETSGRVLRIDPRSGVVSSRLDAPPNVSGLTWDGSFLWLADFADGRLLRLDTQDGSIERRAVVPGQPTGLAFDGDRFWYADGESGQTCRILDDLLA